MIRLFAFLCALISPLAYAGLIVDTVGAITNNVPLAAHNAALGALETSNGGTTARLNTISASTVVATGAAMLKRVIVVASTAATITIYDDATVPCDAAGVLQKTGALPLLAGTPQELGIEVGVGLCILTGAGALDITVVYLP